MNGTARAAVFHAAGRPHELRAFELPGRLRPGELVVRIRLATVCGSDLHTVHGRRVETTPCVLGHEGVGIVVDAGAGREPMFGRRITWASSVGCGTCTVCTDDDLPQKCSRVLKYGHVALDDDRPLRGTYASHIVLQPGTHVVPLPDSLPDAVAAPSNCALATMIAAIESRPSRCDLAVVQGAGMLGLFGCALLRTGGVARVVVVDPEPERRELVAAFGGEPVADASEIDAGSADLVLEACGVAAVLPEGLELLRTGGRYTLVGTVLPGPVWPIHADALVRRCLTVRGIHNYAPRHLDAAVAFLTEHHASLPLAELVREPIALDDIDEAFADAAGQRQFLRWSIAPSGTA